MEPGKIRFGGGANATLLHPVVAIWMLIAIVLILILPRKKAIAPFLLAIFTIPIGTSSARGWRALHGDARPDSGWTLCEPPRLEHRHPDVGFRHALAPSISS